MWKSNAPLKKRSSPEPGRVIGRSRPAGARTAAGIHTARAVPSRMADAARAERADQTADAHRPEQHAQGARGHPDVVGQEDDDEGLVRGEAAVADGRAA